MEYWWMIRETVRRRDEWWDFNINVYGNYANLMDIQVETARLRGQRELHHRLLRFEYDEQYRR